MIFSPHFHFKAFPEKERERERERERVRARGEETEQSVRRSPADSDLQSDDRREDRDRRRDLVPSRDRDREIAPSRARASDRDRRREIAPSRDRDLRSIVRLRRRELALLIARLRSLMIFFLGLSFPSSFPNIRKYFPENFLKCNQTHENIFLFRSEEHTSELQSQ